MAPASGTIPNGSSGNPNSTCSAAMIKSQAIAISNPPPIAKPLRAPITGLFKSHISVNPAKPPAP